MPGLPDQAAGAPHGAGQRVPQLRVQHELTLVQPAPPQDSGGSRNLRGAQQKKEGRDYLQCFRSALVSMLLSQCE